MSHQRLLNAIYLATMTLIAAWMRLRQLEIPSFWFDEIVHYDIASAAAKQPLWRWFTIFEVENGPIFYAGQLFGRIARSPEFSARIVPALCGVATIPLIWFAARAISAYRAIPYVVAPLLVFSPLHVYYSREARPYALVVLVTTALLGALLRDARVITLIALLFISLYSGAVIAPVIASIVVGALIVAAVTQKRCWWIIASLSLGCAILLALCYHPAGLGGEPMFSRSGWPFIRGLLESFSIVAVDATRPHRGAYVFAFLALAGAVALLRRSKHQAIVVIAIGLLPVAIGVTATWQLHRQFGVRYIIGGLPGYLLLVAAGVSAIVSQLHRWRIDVLAGVLAAGLLAYEGLDAALNEPFQKLDWRTVARAIVLHAHENDAVIAADTWTFEQIGFYLRGLSTHVRLFDAGGHRVAGEVIAYQNTTSWLVVGDNSTEFAGWACRFPIVLASTLQNFRLHYCPSAYYFLTDRSAPGEHRALLASFLSAAPSLQFGPGDDIFLGPGWSGAEPEEGRYARWAIGRQSFIALPFGKPSDWPINIDIAPADAKRQTLSVSLNDDEIANVALFPGRRRYTLHGTFRTGINILRFDFGHATAPVDIDPHSSDHRPLAARVFEVSVGTAFSGSNDAHLLRLDERDAYLDETSVWREQRGRPLPSNVDRAKLTHFVGRLGFDPQRAVNALIPGRVTLANLSTTLADDSACTNDEQFLRTLFPALLGREISDRELKEFTVQLERGVSRQTIVRRLANSDEVRAQLR